MRKGIKEEVKGSPALTLRSPKGRRRILSLDGGGTRGYLSLLILEKLEQALRDVDGENAKLTDYFDLICGTSTGGIIALGLQQGKSIAEIKDLYKDLAKRVFGGLMGWEWHGWSIWHPMRLPRAVFTLGTAWYDEGVLETVLKDIFKEERMTKKAESDINIFVVATENTTNSPYEYLFRNYPAPVEGEVTSHSSLYAGGKDVLIREAARATSAAPTYFRPKFIANKEYVDGGILANNPTEIAFHEANLLWKSDLIDVVVSVGTGVASINPKRLTSFFTWPSKLASIATDSSQIEKNFDKWRRIINTTRNEDNHLIYRRLEPPKGETTYTDSLDYWKKATFAEWESVMLKENKALNKMIAEIVDRIRKQPKNTQ